VRPADDVGKDGAEEGRREDGEYGGLEQCSVFIITYPYISIASFYPSQFPVEIE